MDKEKIIREKLAAIDVEFDMLKQFQKDYLYQIEDIIQKKDQILQEIPCLIKSSIYSIKSISQEIGMARTTFYNYSGLLQRYVEYSLTKSEKINPYKEIEKLKQTVQELKSKIFLLETRDIDVLLLKKENKQLKSTIKEKNKEIERLRGRVIELEETNHSAK